MTRGNGGGGGIDLASHDSHVRDVQRAQRDLASRVLEGMREALAVPEVSDEIGTHQRYQVRVPTTETPDGTVVSMGRRAEGRNYDGYGLTTVAHVAVSAEGGKTASTLTLQSNGQALVQSDDDSAYVVSKGPAVLASAAVVNVVASGGLVLAAGGAVEVANAAIEGEKPAAPGALSGHGDLMGEAADLWSTWSDDAGDAATERDELVSDMDPDEASEWKPTQDEVKAKDLAKEALQDRNELGSAAANEDGGVAIFGKAGVLLATPKFAAIHAADALTMTSTMPALVGFDALELVAGNDARLTAGRHTAIYASQKLRLIANEGDLTIATRSGDVVEVLAKAVHLGELEPDDPQTETELVSLRAKNRISLATDKDSGRDEGDDGVFVETHEVIEIKGDKTILVEGAEEITLRIADNDYDIVIDDEGKITIRSDQTQLAISDDDGLVFGDDEDDYLTASSDGVFAGIDSDNCLDISSSEVAIKGNRIEIG